MDVVWYSEAFPALLAMAKRLGHTELVVIGMDPRRAQELSELSSIACIPGAFVEERDLGKARAGVVVIAGPARGCIVHPKTVAIMGAEIEERKDKLHQRNSGLTAVTARLAAQGSKVLLLDCSLLRFERKHQILGRFAQNVLLARKSKLPVLVVSGARAPFEMRAAHELHALGTFLGIPPRLITQAQRRLQRVPLGEGQ